MLQPFAAASCSTEVSVSIRSATMNGKEAAAVGHQSSSWRNGDLKAASGPPSSWSNGDLIPRPSSNGDPVASDSDAQSSNESSYRSNGSKATDAERAYQRLRDTVLKSAAIGLALRGGLSALSVLLSQLSKRKRAAKRSGQHLRSLVVDVLRYGAFLAAFGGTYVAVDEGVGYVAGKERSKNWRAAVAGACAAPAILLSSTSSHSGLASYIFLRGMLLLVRCANKPGAPRLLRAAVAPSRWEHSDTLLMCIASSQILPSWLVAPETLPGSYVKFLNAQGGKRQFVYDGLREWARRNSAAPAPLSSLSDTPRFSGKPVATPCEFAHPGVSCTRHSVAQLPSNLRRAMSVYIPVYVIPALLVHRQNILKQPLDISSKVVKGIARSSLFLAVYVALAWRGACAVHWARDRVPPRLASSAALYALTVWTAGAATLLEKKSRRLELAMYCMSRALVSFVQSLSEGGYLPRVLSRIRGDVIVFAAGLAAITHCYSDGDGCHRDVFKSKYLSVLDFVFGNKGFSRGSIRHVPSSNHIIQSLLSGSSSSSGLLLQGRRSFSTGSLQQLMQKQQLQRRQQQQRPEGPLSPSRQLNVEHHSASSSAALTSSASSHMLSGLLNSTPSSLPTQENPPSTPSVAPSQQQQQQREEEEEEEGFLAAASGHPVDPSASSSSSLSQFRDAVPFVDDGRLNALS